MRKELMIETLAFKKMRLARETQNRCSHLQSNTGNVQSHHSSFVFLELTRVHEIIGVCQYCQKKISSLNPEDLIYFKMPRCGTLARSGVEVPVPPEEQAKAYETLQANNALTNLWSDWHKSYDLED